MTTTPPQDGRTESLRVRLTLREFRELKLFCIEEHITVSDLVRELIADYMNYRKEEKR